MPAATADLLASLLATSQTANNYYLLNIQAVPLSSATAQHLQSLSVSQVEQQLLQLGVQRDDAQLLVREDVDGAAVQAVANQEVLTQLGVPTFGRRQQLIRALQQVLASALTSSSSSSSSGAVSAAPKKVNGIANATSANDTSFNLNATYKPSTQPSSSNGSVSNKKSSSGFTGFGSSNGAASSPKKLSATTKPASVSRPGSAAPTSNGLSSTLKPARPSLGGVGINGVGLGASKPAAAKPFGSGKPERTEEKTAHNDDGEDNFDELLDDDDELEREYVNPRVAKANAASSAIAGKKPVRAAAAAGDDEDDLFATGESSTAQEFMAVKPWLGSIVAPSKAPPNNPAAPSQKLKLEWIHGYRGFDSRMNVVYNTAAEVVYPVAAIVVVYNTRTGKQRHFQGHTDDIRCLTQSPVDSNIIASGQNATIVNGKGTPPTICVFDSSQQTFSESVILKLDKTDRAVRTLSFSADGKYLVSVSNDDAHTVKVWDWQAKTLVAQSKGDVNPIWHVKWNHKDNTEFVTVGKRHAMRWEFTAGKLVGKKLSLSGAPESLSTTVSFYSVAFSEKGYACLGADNGAVYIYTGGKLAKVFQNIHKSKVTALEWYPGGLVSGGSDNTVKVLDRKMDVAKTLTAEAKIQSVQIRNNKLLIGTDGSEIFEVADYMNANGEESVESQYEAITTGHSDGELWGLAVCNDAEHYVTVGEDNMIGIWNHHTHKLVKKAIITDVKGKRPKIQRASTTSLHPSNQCGRAIAISPNNQHIIVGTNDGLVHVYDSTSLERLAQVDVNKYGKRQVTNQADNWIQVISYSPNNQYAAVGTHGSVIVLLDVARNYSVATVLKSHNSFLTHIDWSTNSAYIQSTCGAYELLFHKIDQDDVKNSKQVTNATLMRDTEWASFTCVFGWPVQGLFTGDMDGQDVSTVDAAPSRTLLVAGDDFGKVNLYRYPALQGNAKSSYSGHSSHVVTTRFTADEKYVLSTGGHDLAIAVWSVQ